MWWFAPALTIVPECASVWERAAWVEWVNKTVMVLSIFQDLGKPMPNIMSADELRKHDCCRIVYDIDGDKGEGVFGFIGFEISVLNSGAAVHLSRVLKLTQAMLEAIVFDAEARCLRLKGPPES